jgi:flagellar biosynthesis/type III secretory pathway protein FliH
LFWQSQATGTFIYNLKIVFVSSLYQQKKENKMQTVIERTKEYKNLKKSNPKINSELLRESAGFRRGLSEGYKRGYEKGLEQGEIKTFNLCTEFLEETLREMHAEGKTLADAIERISK